MSDERSGVGRDSDGRSADTGVRYVLAVADEAVARVRVKRLRAFEGTARVWHVFVDGQEAAALGAGDECELRVHPGQHLLEVRPGRPGKGDSRAFLVAAGDVAEFDCRPAPGIRLRPAVLLQESSSSRIFGTPPPDAAS